MVERTNATAISKWVGAHKTEIGTAALAVVAAIALTCGACILCHRVPQLHRLPQFDRSLLMSAGTVFPVISEATFLTIRSRMRKPVLDIEEEVKGAGAFKELRFGELKHPGGRVVAVACLFEKERGEIAGELALLKKVEGNEHVMQPIQEVVAFGMRGLVYPRCNVLEDEAFVENLPFNQLVSIFQDYAKGLNWMHERGLVHCDVKPENLLIAPDGRGKVGDFGLLAVEGKPTLQATFYMRSPEMAVDQTALTGRDVWAWGVTAYMVFAGHDNDWVNGDADFKEGTHADLKRLKSIYRLPPALTAIWGAEPEDTEDALRGMLVYFTADLPLSLPKGKDRLTAVLEGSVKAEESRLTMRAIARELGEIPSNS